MIQGHSALVAVRLKVDRGHISEIEQLYDRNINDAAIPLLTTPRPGLVTDIPVSEQSSRAVLPNPDTPQGKDQLKFSMLTCSARIDSKIFAYMKHIRPRHAVIVDQQKGVATMFVLSSTMERDGALPPTRLLACS
jgi:hypothetical protein